ncbi:MAG TPA: HIT family protein [Syntrophomonadaceae bacterium]|nr:HIT family protein [Syntrophomonadaceae bacterium]
MFARPRVCILENQLAFAIYDKYPVVPGHMLIITKRHTADFFATTDEERVALSKLLNEAKAWLDREFKPDGYNLGINCGVDAGQTVMHLHIHLIPCYRGDLENPQGGVRGAIPDKRIY